MTVDQMTHICSNPLSLLPSPKLIPFSSGLTFIGALVRGKEADLYFEC